MNANELADYMDNNVEAMLMSEQKYIDEAATMLRQQQAEIEALKGGFFDWSGFKKLTDEEIVSLYESSYLESGLNEWEFDPVYFARAILRKAQK